MLFLFSRALNYVAGHEITHILEGTELYTELQMMLKTVAESKGEYQSRYDEISKLYEGVEGANIEQELTADLVGDYLFTDREFIKRLSTEKPGVFKKIYNEIKYLCKVATAGSKEARELERVKRNFEKAYKEVAKSGAKVEGTKHSLNDNIDKFWKNDYNEDTHYGENLKDTPVHLKPTTDTEWQVFCRGFANKTSNIASEKQNITIFTADYQYLVVADGYMSGRIVDKVDVNLYDESGDFYDNYSRSNVSDSYDEGKRNRQRNNSNGIEPSENEGADLFYVELDKFIENHPEYFSNIRKAYSVDRKRINSDNIDLFTNEASSEDGVFFDAENKKYSLSEAEDNYNEAVKNKDIETAQRIVDEVARKNGYTIHSYHGTRDKNFTEFKKDFIGSRFSFDDKGFFFIDRKSIADDYAHSEFNADAYGRVLDVYLKVKKPLMVDKNFCLKEGLGNPFRDDDAIGVWDAYSEFFKEEAENRKSDGIILDDGMSKMTVVFDPNQIKSADAVTYDDNGNVIPLSKRFNTEKKDIRYSLSSKETTPAKHGDYAVYGEDVMFEKDDLAPVKETTEESSATVSETEQVEPTAQSNVPTVNEDDYAPMTEDAEGKKKAIIGAPMRTDEKNDLLSRSAESFGITKPGDYVQVQRQVFDTLEKEGFFSDEGSRSRTVTNSDSSMQVEINKKGIKETFNYDNYGKQGIRKKAMKLATVRMLPQIIENGKLVSDDVDNYHNEESSVKFAYIESEVEIDGQSIYVKIDIKKSPQKNKFWVHSINIKEKVNGLPANDSKSLKRDYIPTDSNESISNADENVNSEEPVDTTVIKTVEDRITAKIENSNGAFIYFYPFTIAHLILL